MSVEYPQTRMVDAQDTLAGVSFKDPYRWLEAQTEEVQLWQRRQAELAQAHVRKWPGFEQVRRLVAHFGTGWQHGDQYRVLPRYAGGRWFRTRITQGSVQQVVVADEPMGEGQVLFDPAEESFQKPPFLSWIAPSPNGRVLAVGICEDGSERNTIRLIDTATGEALANPPSQVLMDCWTGGVQWLADSSGFFFSALVGAPEEFRQGVYFHGLESQSESQLLDVPWVTARGTDYRWVVVTADGRHAVAMQNLITPVPIAVAALEPGRLQWRPFVNSFVGRLAGHLMGDQYIAVTELGAPRGRIVSIALNSEHPNSPEGWEELIAESDAVLLTLTPVGELLYLVELVDCCARVRIIDRLGSVVGEMPLPDRGALPLGWTIGLHSTIPKGHPEKFLFFFSSPVASAGMYCHTPGETRLETLRPPQARLEDTVVESHWAVSSDGTRIPYHLVRRSDLDPRQPQPTLLCAYGGYGLAYTLQFPGPMAAFVAAGGALVYAHVRGGGEFGLEWWQRGKLADKQNCYDDLYAIAEHLIASKRCTQQLLALTGRSNGGLVAAAALTQRPDLWRVVVPQVPLADLIGGCRDPYGRAAIVVEYAGDDDPDEVRRLATLSPYHLVREAVRYPAVFIPAGDTDPRCPPWHARKLAASLQHASTGDGPILLHVWENVGHGAATDKSIAVADHAEWLAFTLMHLGMNQGLTMPRSIR